MATHSSIHDWRNPWSPEDIFIIFLHLLNISLPFHFVKIAVFVCPFCRLECHGFS